MASTLFTQEIRPDSSFHFSGYVISASDSSKTPNVHILNLSKGTGTISSVDGSFFLNVRDRDTLRFSCIGFQDRLLLISLNVLREDIMIYLPRDTVLMDELLVHPLGPRRFFKYKFMALKIPEKINKFEMNPNALSFPVGEVPIPQTGIIFPGPVGLLYNAFNKQARTSRKLRKNRKKYEEYLVPEGGDSLVWPKAK